MNRININQVQDLINLKLEAIKSKDLLGYLNTVSSNNDNYVNEETGWFNVMIADSFKNLSLNVVSIKQLSKEKVEAIIQLKHQYNDDINIQYPLLVGFENEVLKDFGLNFKVIDSKRYIMKYFEGETRINEFQDIVEMVFDNIEKIFNLEIHEKIELKIFPDLELLRQRTYPSIEWLFPGWSEQNESLKIYSGLENINNYKSLIQHELVHKVTFQMADGKAESWLNEGIAMYYGNANYPYKDDFIYSNIFKYNLEKTLEDLKAFKYYYESDLHLLSEWYAVCGLYVKYMIEHYSHEKVLKLFFEMGKFNKMEESKKLEQPEFLKMLCGIVLGDEETEISKGYLSWISKQKITLD